MKNNSLDLTDPRLRENPYAVFRQLRAENPVCKLNIPGQTNAHWLVSRHEDVLATLKNPQVFRSANIGESEKGLKGPEFLMKSRGLIGTDRPDHTRLRGLIAKAFTPKVVASLEPRIRSVCRDLVNGFSECKNETDFVHEIAAPLPITVVSELIGVGAERRLDFKRWTDTLLTWRQYEKIENLEERKVRLDEVSSDIEKMHKYFTELIAERTAHPKDDLLSALIQARENDSQPNQPKLSSEEILGFARLLLVAGTETTTHLLSNMILALIRHPDTLARVRADRTLIPTVIEETLRYDSPALSLIRRANEAVTLRGVSIGKDEIILPLLVSANHDESIFAEPEKFDVNRGGTQSHLSFGFGSHFCLGSNLARLQTRIALEEILNKFASIELASTAKVEYLPSFFFRGPQRLILVCH